MRARPDAWIPGWEPNRQPTRTEENKRVYDSLNRSIGAGRELFELLRESSENDFKFAAMTAKTNIWSEVLKEPPRVTSTRTGGDLR